MQPLEVIDLFHKLDTTQQMRVAANVLVTVSERHAKALNPFDTGANAHERKWSAGTLRVKASEWEREERLAAEAEAARKAEVDELTNDLLQSVLKNFNSPQPGEARQILRRQAESLVAAGWTKNPEV